ncbi:uncharacterized protein ACLA_066500 [Aspergillus clavatus NRRL 1]|uniref:Uncharacterized protein n=1 Tax=Aspergillus clavatus (strain ATCC 1007 / CBS 513.65 / DSM 816 / NCTC 3887 / NRRL 1 / QM 1276 / 107) TaxID=344612 RepID=A1CGD4_ASPCL|nr:uncharacterized protein ACLA_066500 [Aspergillus clavatus NRRL 1]EAW11014.1 hypothetical protein ACLA_066500 [Aspergillus clavatus NRRL 1]
MPNISLSRAVSRPNPNAYRKSAQGNAWPKGFHIEKTSDIPKYETTNDDAKVWQHTSNQQPPTTRPAVADSNKNHIYYSLKKYREGPNPESGELGKDYDSEEVKTHNRDVDYRHRND